MSDQSTLSSLGEITSSFTVRGTSIWDYIFIRICIFFLHLVAPLSTIYSLARTDRYLAKWFLDAPPAEIRWENIKDFFRWAFLNTRELEPAYNEELEKYEEME